MDDRARRPGGCPPALDPVTLWCARITAITGAACLTALATAAAVLALRHVLGG